MSHTVQELSAIRVIAHSTPAWAPGTDPKKGPPHLTGDRLGACIRAVDASGHIHQYQGGLNTHYVICSSPLTEHGSCPGLVPIRIETGYSTKPAGEMTDEAAAFRRYPHPDTRPRDQKGVSGAHSSRTQRQGRKEEE